MDVAESSKLSDGNPAPLWMFWKRRRYCVVFMSFLGFFNVYALRVNLSVAIVAMTENRTVDYGNGTIGYEQYFDWSSQMQGFVLSSFFYGYILTPFLGGFISNKLGGNYVFGVGVGTTALLTILTPLATKGGVGLLIAVRIIEGIFEGVTFPCIHAVWSRWAPPTERSRMASIAFAGNYAGTVVAMPLSGVFANAYGWESVFYIFGVVGCIWFVAWIFLVKTSPEVDPWISSDEKEFILASLGRTEGKPEKIKHPWKGILTSMAVWALVASHVAENWGFYTLLTQLPTFLKDTMHFHLEKTGFISAIPYLAMGILLFVAGYLADLCQLKGWLTTTQVRRYFNCGAFLGQTVFMIIGAFILEPGPTIACITIAVGMGAFAWSGFAVNHLDLSPKSAGVLMGISNTFATIPGIVSPIVTGYITANKTDDEWRVVFYIAAGIYLVGCVIYWFWASGELQPWSIEAQEKAAQELNGRKNGHFGYENKMKIEDEM
ncbi:sialin [Toxorhynchites rutilus septentrionalis]|uniref:sialin n=1 Tax=Toxorhynchites rutilus septentrionalis TaxID=329112 RepID=UPI00247AC6E8|nr:sialin [Toxorhynchites rutilus septentrionalis]XP_055627578.1 sialin [Toxorhynchites rutilus septentrionalis]XP_055627579.1 sialin [Toxorhynchites rutilus septentrionalis]XP_055627580.1 sialin [Toxorhynchites rutilus septentrionalis]